MALCCTLSFHGHVGEIVRFNQFEVHALLSLSNSRKWVCVVTTQGGDVHVCLAKEEPPSWVSLQHPTRPLLDTLKAGFELQRRNQDAQPHTGASGAAGTSFNQPIVQCCASHENFQNGSIQNKTVFCKKVLQQ